MNIKEDLMDFDLAKNTSPIGRTTTKKQLHKEIVNLDSTELRQLVLDLKAKLDELEDLNVDLRVQLTNIADERDTLKKKMENDLNAEGERKQIYDQILYKDNRIMELNNVILEKERHIIDLQEICSEQGQVAKSKSLAMHIVNKRLQELDDRQTKDVSTETDPVLSMENHRSRSPRGSQRSTSPGRAIPQFKLPSIVRNGSPPPLDPAEDASSVHTTETGNMMDGTDSTKMKKYRKRVTFEVDGHQQARTTAARNTDELLERRSRHFVIPDDYEELAAENEQLRRVISEMEKSQSRVSEVKTESTTQVLKAKAAAQIRIKELEATIAQTKLAMDSEISIIRATIGQLEESREWTLSENAKLNEQLCISKEKSSDLQEELEASLETTDVFRKRADDLARKLDGLTTELYQSRAQIQQVSDEKAILNSEIEQMKEAIFAQDEFISLLEGDLIVYEAHVGILRDSLGASKKEDRQHIKSKAYAAKINALETEKEEIIKKNSEEKLRVKALAVKIRHLEEERKNLKTKMREMESQLNVESEQMEMQNDYENASVDSHNSHGQEQIFELEQLIKSKNEEFNSLAKEKQISDQKVADLLNQTHKLEGVIVQFLNSFLHLFKLSKVRVEDLTLEQIVNSKDFAQTFDVVIKLVTRILEDMSKLNDKIDIYQKQINQQQEKLNQFETEMERLDSVAKLSAAEFHKQRDEFQEQIAIDQQKILELDSIKHELEQDLSVARHRIESIEAICKSLEEEKNSLDVQLQHSFDKLEQCVIEKVELKQTIESDNVEKERLLGTLSEERTRMRKLINLLTEIVRKFDCESSLHNSDNTFDELMDNIQSNIKKNKALDNRNDERLPEKDGRQGEEMDCSRQEKLEHLFRKSVSIQSDLLQKIDVQTKCIQTDDDEQEKLALKLKENEVEWLQIERKNLEKKVVDLQIANTGIESRRACFSAKLDDSVLEFDKKRQENLFLEESNRKLADELADLKGQFDAVMSQSESIDSGKNVSKGIVEIHVQTEPIHRVDKAIGTVVAASNAGLQINIENEVHSKYVQTSLQMKAGFANADDQQIGDETTTPPCCLGQSECLIRQESRQLLMDCIQDREEFERGLAENVSQLCELKMELEVSVDSLKGEIWSLNEELKKKFNEKEFLVKSLEESKSLFAQSKTENDQMREKLGLTTEQLGVLQIKLDRCLADRAINERELLSLRSHANENAATIDSLNALLAKCKLAFGAGTGNLREELTQMKVIHENYAADFANVIGKLQEQLASLFRRDFTRPLNCIKCLQHLQDDTKLVILAARLTTKSKDNDALFRENAELIEMNMRLRTEVDKLQEKIAGNSIDKGEEGHQLRIEEKESETGLQMTAIGGEQREGTEAVIQFKQEIAVNLDVPFQKQSEEFKVPEGDEGEMDDNWKWDENEEENMINEESQLIESNAEGQQGEDAKGKWDAEEEAENEDEHVEDEVKDDWKWDQAEKGEERRSKRESVGVEESAADDDWAWDGGKEDQEEPGEEEEREEEEERAAYTQNANEDWSWNEDEVIEGREGIPIMTPSVKKEEKVTHEGRQDIRSLFENLM